MNKAFHIFDRKWIHYGLRILLLIVVSFVLWLFIVLQGIRVFLPSLFPITGFPLQSKTYLVLLQNNAELRPGGGFIAAFGELTFHFGIIPELRVQDVFTLNGYKDDKIIEPPYPMGELLKSPYYKGYSFHDSNWMPDLAVASKDILKLYHDEFPNKQIDGIVAVNYQVVEDLLGIMQPLIVDGETLTKDTFFHATEHAQSNIDLHDWDQIATRKNFLQKLAPVFLKKLMFSLQNYGEYSRTLVEALQKKDITFYFADTDLEKKFAAMNWTGSFPSPEKNENIFAVVEANLGGMKSDRYLKKRYLQRVELVRSQSAPFAPEKLVVSNTIRMSHLGLTNPPFSDVYSGFFRVYIPKDAILTTKDNEATVFNELGYMVVGKKLSLAPKEEKTWSFSYELPLHYVEGNMLKTHVFRQSGLQDTLFEQEILLPQDYLVHGKEYKVTEQVARFTKEIEKDEELTASFTEDTTPPRVTNQLFTDYNRILLEFNEPLLKSDCENPDNYKMTDTDKKVDSASSRVTVREVKCSGRQAIVYTRNISKQYGEIFTLQLKNLRDISNNVISPNPLVITLIQRLERDAPVVKAKADQIR